MENKTQNIIIKYIAQSIDNILQDDIIVMINTNSDEHLSPIVFSLSNIWEKGQYIETEKENWLTVERKLTKILKELQHDYLNELIRLLTSDELYDLSIWVNISDKISPYIALAYISLHDNSIIHPMVEKIDRIFDNVEEYLSEIKEKYNISKILEKGVESNE